MDNDYVSRIEFNAFKQEYKQELKEMQKDREENQKLLQDIDKKVDIITTKVSDGDKIANLKLQPLERRVDAVEDSQKWLRRTILGSVIAMVFEAIGLVFAFLK